MGAAVATVGGWSRGWRRVVELGADLTLAITSSTCDARDSRYLSSSRSAGRNVAARGQRCDMTVLEQRRFSLGRRGAVSVSRETHARRWVRWATAVGGPSKVSTAGSLVFDLSAAPSNGDRAPCPVLLTLLPTLGRIRLSGFPSLLPLLLSFRERDSVRCLPHATAARMCLSVRGSSASSSPPSRALRDTPPAIKAPVSSQCDPLRSGRSLAELLLTSSNPQPTPVPQWRFTWNGRWYPRVHPRHVEARGARLEVAGTLRRGLADTAHCLGPGWIKAPPREGRRDRSH